MYSKIQNLIKLESSGLNVHEYSIPTTQAEFLDTINKFDNFLTIRTDLPNISENLPFYIITPETPENILLNIWNLGGDYKFILTNGVKYGTIQEFNMVVNLKRDGSFLLEASNLKVPLRKMYNYPTFACSGDIKDDISEWLIYRTIPLDRSILKRRLLDIYAKGIRNCYLEVTTYPNKVGILEEEMVFW